jgi:hypothetical protein
MGVDAPDMGIAPHWFTTPQAETALKEAKNPFDFGIAMHKYQDSFSHWQKLGKPDTPLGIYSGHFWNNFEGNVNKKVDTFDLRRGAYKDIDWAMWKGMISGFAYKRTRELARSQLQKIAHPK